MPLAGALLPALTLAAAEGRLADCNRDVLAAARAVEAEEADRITAGQRPNPNLTLGATNINSKAGVGAGALRDKTFDQIFRVDQLIERGGKAELRERQADALLAAVRADYRDVVRQQRLALRTAYFELAFQQERAELAREFAAISRASLKAAEKRLGVGDIAPNEANRFRLDEARADNDLKVADADLKRARSDFARVIGAESQWADIRLVPAAPMEADPPAAIDSSRRPDVMAAKSRVDAATFARDLAKAISTRDVSVGAQYERWPVSDSNGQGTGNSVGLSISIPLFVRHANEGEARRALVDLDTARDLAERLLVQAQAESRLAADAWGSARGRALRVERELLPLAREVARAAEFAYSKGATGVFDLLDARRNLKQAELDAAQARADSGKCWAQFEAANDVIAGNGT